MIFPIKVGTRYPSHITTIIFEETTYTIINKIVLFMPNITISRIEPQFLRHIKEPGHYLKCKNVWIHLKYY